MPKVDPETGEPVSDDPSGPIETSGGKVEGDPGMEDATPEGASGPRMD